MAVPPRFRRRRHVVGAAVGVATAATANVAAFTRGHMFQSRVLSCSTVTRHASTDFGALELLSATQDSQSDSLQNVGRLNFGRRAASVVAAATVATSARTIATAAPRQAVSGDDVLVFYTGRLEDGSIFDTTQGKEPFAFKLGAGEVVPGFEAAVIGLQAGKKITVTVPPEKAYGNRDESLVFTVPASQVPKGLPQGAQVAVGGRPAVVKSIRDDGAAIIDANAPLAGKSLTFDIEFVGFREPPKRGVTMVGWQGKTLQVPIGLTAQRSVRRPFVTMLVNSARAPQTDSTSTEGRNQLAEVFFELRGRGGGGDALAQAAIAAEQRRAAIGVAECLVRIKEVQSQAGVEERRLIEEGSTQRCRITEEQQTRRYDRFAVVANVALENRSQTERAAIDAQERVARDTVAVNARVEECRIKHERGGLRDVPAILSTIVLANAALRNFRGRRRVGLRQGSNFPSGFIVLVATVLAGFWLVKPANRLHRLRILLGWANYMFKVGRACVVFAIQWARPLPAPLEAPVLEAPIETSMSVGEPAAAATHQQSSAPAVQVSVPEDDSLRGSTASSANASKGAAGTTTSADGATVQATGSVQFAETGATADPTPFAMVSGRTVLPSSRGVMPAPTYMPTSGDVLPEADAKLRAELRSWGLSDYAEALEAKGYDAEVFDMLTTDDAEDMMRTVCCKPGHRVRFRRMLQQRRSVRSRSD